MIFSDLMLARRLEAAEGFAGAQFAEARSRLFPQCGSTWTKCAGATLIFDGIDAPTTQSFGLGIFEEVTPAALDEIESFFESRDAAVMHEVSPMAGAAMLELLCARNYRPFEVSSVLYRSIEKPGHSLPGNIRVRVIEQEEAEALEQRERAGMDARSSRAGGVYSADGCVVCGAPAEPVLSGRG